MKSSNSHTRQRALEAGRTARPLRFLQVHLFYDHYQADFYRRRPELVAAPFSRQIDALVGDGFAGIHMVAPYMRQLGYDSHLVIANNPHSQTRWLEENGKAEVNTDDWIWQITKAQIDQLKPDVLYLTEPLLLDSRFLRTLSHKPELVIGWRAAHIPAGTDWSEFDVILSCLSGIRSAALELGAKASEHFLPGFPSWIHGAVEEVEPANDVVFCGQWTQKQHPRRNALLDELAREADRPSAQFSCAFHLSGETEHLTAPVAARNLGALYGLDMYRALRAGRIAFDARGEIGLQRPPAGGDEAIVDLAGDETANMRIFEATGCGRLLLTEHRENLADLFEPGREIETFRSSAELFEKIRYYTQHPREREQIAERGLERCHQEHSMETRIRDLDALIRRHLERKRAIELRSPSLASVEPISPTCSNRNPDLTPEAFDVMLPETFTIETALACNLKCPECAIGADVIARTKNLMRFDRFKLIADKIRPYARYVYLHLWGEPMLNKQIFEMIEHVSEFSRSNISTNALLFDEVSAERLITSGVSDVIVSIDGFTQEVYEKYRVGGDVSRAFDGLRMLRDANLRHGNPVQLIPQFIAFKHNQHEMDDFREFCAGLGLSPSFKAPYIRNDDSQFEKPDDPRLRRPEYATEDSLRLAMMECSNPKEVFTIHSDGSVVICCHDYDRITCFGNIFEQDVLEIWNDPEFRRYRWNVLSGNAPSFCVKGCMTWTLERGSQSQAELGEAESPVAQKINLCCGPIHLPGFINADIAPNADVVLDLERDLLPFESESADTVVCISAINYFTYERAGEIIGDVLRVLRPGGLARFATQDLEVLAQRYLERDRGFWLEKQPNGQDRLPGATFSEKLNHFFTGFPTGGKRCRFVHDFESLALLFERAGFSQIERKRYLESDIPEIEAIDNRPEQMFFLEARKPEPSAGDAGSETREVGLGNVAAQLPQANELWKAGRREEAWQSCLDLLHRRPQDRTVVLSCARLMLEEGRDEHAHRLLTDYAKMCPGDEEVEQRLAEVGGLVERASAPEELKEQRRQALREREQRPPLVRGDLEHLRGCIDWLSRAQAAWPGGGLATSHRILEARWDVDYPETTGYIIPSFLQYQLLTRDEDHLRAALEMGDWELSIQTSEGGIGEPVGVYGALPRIFNTSQVLLGWVALYRRMGDVRYLEAAERAGDWLVQRQDPDGKWSQNTYAGPRSYHARTAWALLELFDATGNETYRAAAERSVRWVISCAQENGWFRNTSLTDPRRPWTHLIGYTLVGLSKIWIHHSDQVDVEPAHHLLLRAAEFSRQAYLERRRRRHGARYAGLPGTLDCQWNGSDTWSCLTGDAQMAFFWALLGTHSGEEPLVKAARSLVDELKSVQLLESENKDLRGGLCGSYPATEGYCANSIPSWGVKFLADCLMQRLLDAPRHRYLG